VRVIHSMRGINGERASEGGSAEKLGARGEVIYGEEFRMSGTKFDFKLLARRKDRWHFPSRTLTRTLRIILREK